MTSLRICLATAASPERVAAVVASLNGLRVAGLEVFLALDDGTDPALEGR